MAKFLSRLALKKVPYCVWLTDFQIFSPSGGQEQTFAELSMELRRGKAKEDIYPAKSSARKQSLVSGPGIFGAQADPKTQISADNQRVIFSGSFVQTSQFYKNNKKDQGQKKIFQITLKSKILDKNGYPGPEKVFGVAQFNMSDYLNQTDKNVEIEMSS